jgi:ligand-binding sensor domain-containing protein
MNFGNWLRDIAGSATNSKKAAKRQRRRSPRRASWVPNLENLEDRFAPAVQLTYGGPATALMLTELTVGATPAVVVSELSSGTLKIDLGAGHAFDASSTGSATGLTYQNANSPTTSQFATVSISNANNISTLQPALPGDTLNLGPINNAAAGLGNVTASAAVINVNALNTALSNGNVSLTASGALTVTSNAVLNTGTGTVSLAADVNADGTGDSDTTDPLAIQSGAVVTSSNTGSNAITLRGAAVNIDTSSNPAQVGRGRPQFSTVPTTTFTGLNAPDGLAFDSSGDLFVSNYSGNTVSEFAPGHTTPTATLTGLFGPTTLLFDKSGNLFVSNAGNDDNGTSVSEFAPGATTPTATLTGVDCPAGLAFDSGGNLFVANFGYDNGTTVSEFAPGATTPKATLTGVFVPGDLIFDRSGDLFVGNTYANNVNFAPGTTVEEFAPGHTSPTATLTGLSEPTGMAFDSSGNLFIANLGDYNGDGTTVSEFAPGGTSPKATLTGLKGPGALVFDNSGNLFVANGYGNTVSEFTPGSTTPSSTLTGLNVPTALIFDQSGDLYATNNAANTVSEFGNAASPPAGGVVIRTAQSSQTMSIGGNASGANINLTNAELGQIFTTAAGSITFGDSAQTGAITFQDATPATTAGASVVVQQSATGAGQIMLNTSSGIALSADNGNVTLNAGTGGIAASATSSTAEVASSHTVTLNTTGAIGSAGSRVQFDAVYAPGGVVVGSTLKPSGIYLGGLGNFTLGNVTGATATLDVIAGNRLILANNAVLNVGGGNASLSAGVGGIAASTGAEIASTGTVTLNTTGFIGSAGNLVQFDAVYVPASVVVGSTQEPSGIYLDGLGSLTLGNLSGATATLDVTAVKTLILANNAVLNAGGGNVNLSAGTGGITANTGSEIATKGTVALDAGGAIGSITQRLEFDAVNTPTSVVIGANTQPSSVYLDGMGNLTLGNVTGSSVNTTLDVTARKGLVVAAGALIATGTGTISLAADVNANGTGDSDTTDALAIQSGAIVTSTNASGSAIKLRGAAFNIDTSSNPAQVGPTAASDVSTTPTTTLTGLTNPTALAFDAHGNLFVPDQGGTTVSEFAPGNTAPTATLTGVSAPRPMAFDSKGDLFVGDYLGTTVLEFLPGKTTPSATLTGLNRPAALVFDKSGNLFVANYNGTTVSEFAPGKTAPTATLTGLNQPRALALDSNGNLFVANRGGTTVSEFAPGSTTPTATLTGLNLPLALAFDSNGNLFVANVGGTTVSEFAPGSTTPTTTLTGLNAPDSLAFDRRGNLFVGNRVNYDGTTISEFAPGSTVPTATLTGLNDPEALAFDSNGDLFVANSANGTGTTVSEFARTPAAGGVVIRAALPSQTMSIGSNASGANINLTNAELAQIVTTPTGLVTFGDTAQTGKITFKGATPAAILGASVAVQQSATGAGQIVLDDSSGSALSVGIGNVALNAGKNGITAIGTNSAADIATTGKLTLNTTGAIGSATKFLLLDGTSTPSKVTIGSTLQPASVSLEGLGILNLWTITSTGAQTYKCLKGSIRLNATLTTTNSNITFATPVVMMATVNMVVGTGTVNMLSKSALTVHINGTTTSTYTQMNVTGSVNLNADSGLGSLLYAAVGYDSQIGDTYTLIQTTAGVQGTFRGLAEGATIAVAGKVYKISYAANGGKNVTLTRVS